MVLWRYLLCTVPPFTQENKQGGIFQFKIKKTYSTLVTEELPIYPLTPGVYRLL